MRDKTRKYSARTIIAVLMMLVATPFASFASASNTYASFEDYCSFEFNDDIGTAYIPNHITNHNSDYAIVEVDPGMYELEFDCVGQVSQGELTVTVEGRSQDGLTTKDPSTVIHSSTTTIDMTTSSQPIQIDATGAIGFVTRVYVDIEAWDLNQNLVDLGSIIQIIPMIDTTNDDTPRVSFWYGKVNQHNENGTWMTDSDGVSGGGTSAQWGSEGWADRKLEYCQKFWPNTVAIEMREFVEKIDFSTRGNSQDYVSYKPVYDCIQSIENDTDENNTDDNSSLSCSLDLVVNPNQAYPGDTITASWTITGDISTQMYVAVFSGWSHAQYYHSSIEQNTGSFSFILPSTLDHTLSYHVYIESADNNVGTEICWRYAAFDVLESYDNVTDDNETIGNDTGDNETGDSGTDDNETIDNDTADNETVGSGTDDNETIDNDTGDNETGDSGTDYNETIDNDTAENNTFTEDSGEEGQTNMDNSSSDTSDEENTEESEEEESSIIGDIIQGILDTISEMIAEIFSEVEKEEEKDSESEEESVESAALE